MVEPQREDEAGPSFAQSDNETRSWLPWLAAGVVVLAGVGLLVALGSSSSSGNGVSAPGVAALDPYAASLVVGDLKMSEASNFAGGKVTYLDGEIENNGNKTVGAITVQVVFRNDLKEIAQKETMPLSLIRTREPYVDTEPVGAAPIKPGQQREFRLIFDSVAPDWNQQYPEVRFVRVTGQ